MNEYKIVNVGANKCLNVYGNNVTTITNHQNVTLWEDTNSNEQKWYVDSTTIGPIKTIIDSSYGLNIYRSGNPYNCDLYTISGNETDAYIVIDSDVLLAGGKIKLSNYDLYLTAESNSNGANVYWGEASNSNLQVWRIISITSESDNTESGNTSTNSSNSSKAISLKMPQNLNHRYRGYLSDTTYNIVYDSGSGICCVADIASYYASRKYSVGDMLRANVYTTTSAVLHLTNVPTASFYGYSNATQSFYFTKIVSELRNRRPVMICFEGNTAHWVVAYGYTGEGTSNASIKVLDPFNSDTSTLIGRDITLSEAMSTQGVSTIACIMTTQSKGIVELTMPRNLNHRYRGYLSDTTYNNVYNAGSQICALADVASYYANKEYFVGDMLRSSVYTINSLNVKLEHVPYTAFSNYSNKTQNEYLYKIKTEINEGKPTLVCLAGSDPHWVVAYGYIEGTVDNSKIKVLDPYNSDTADLEGRYVNLATAMSDKGANSISYIVTTQLKSTNSELVMPQNLNQKYREHPQEIIDYGCCICCVCDLISFYENKIQYMAQMDEKHIHLTNNPYCQFQNITEFNWTPVYKNSQGEYLSEIKAQINKGRPVLIEIASDQGGMHWVVAYSYTGDGTSISQCKVLDPYNPISASKVGRRVTLAQAMDDQNNGNYYISHIRTTWPLDEEE